MPVTEADIRAFIMADLISIKEKAKFRFGRNTTTLRASEGKQIVVRRQAWPVLGIFHVYWSI